MKVLFFSLFSVLCLAIRDDEDASDDFEQDASIDGEARFGGICVNELDSDETRKTGLRLTCESRSRLKPVKWHCKYTARSQRGICLCLPEDTSVFHYSGLPVAPPTQAILMDRSSEFANVAAAKKATSLDRGGGRFSWKDCQRIFRPQPAPSKLLGTPASIADVVDPPEFDETVRKIKEKAVAFTEASQKVPRSPAEGYAKLVKTTSAARLIAEAADKIEIMASKPAQRLTETVEELAVEVPDKPERCTRTSPCAQRTMNRDTVVPVLEEFVAVAEAAPMVERAAKVAAALPRVIAEVASSRVTPDVASPRLIPEVASPRLMPEVASPRLMPEVASPRLIPELASSPVKLESRESLRELQSLASQAAEAAVRVEAQASKLQKGSILEVADEMETVISLAERAVAITDLIAADSEPLISRSVAASRQTLHNRETILTADNKAYVNTRKVGPFTDDVSDVSDESDESDESPHAGVAAARLSLLGLQATAAADKKALLDPKKIPCLKTRQAILQEVVPRLQIRRQSNDPNIRFSSDQGVCDEILREAEANGQSGCFSCCSRVLYNHINKEKMEKEGKPLKGRMKRLYKKATGNSKCPAF